MEPRSPIRMNGPVVDHGPVAPGMRVHYTEHRPSPCAAHLIDVHWTFATGGRSRDLSPVQQCVPMGMVEIILMVRGRSHGFFNGRWVRLPRQLVVGIMREPVQ